MEITMQKSLQMVQELSKRNRDLEGEVKRLKDEKFSKTTFKKWYHSLHYFRQNLREYV